MWAGAAALLALTVYSTGTGSSWSRKYEPSNARAAALLQHRHDLEAELERTRRESVILTIPPP